ncbi:diguanylate cyclase (GGDEF)-like protein [Breoghania corrubedonensis]|uniref:diguanylate cyclase n=1 Tax=Breoghania corrubedonensis TaxID=665038 RepID=A0A2T5VCM8_9HYPH|nr:GGDEF domain-containing protein [Breoghania corrubedonensis]PTW61507.1 diguanylate cyclase (GGDEF)-like protein [Breoghania corrubedonensis]
MSETRLMRLDSFTLVVVLGTICVLTGSGFGIGWWRYRTEPALGHATTAFGLTALGCFLYLARGRIPDLLTIDIANAALFAALAIGWNAIRAQNGRQCLVWPLVLSCGLWLALCRFPPFYADTTLRTAAASLLIAGLSLGCLFEFMRLKNGARPIRMLLLVACAGNAAGFLLRGIYSLLAWYSGGSIADNIWVSLALLGALIFICALVLGSLWLWQERVFGQLQHEVEVDPLTGILNRRAFERGAVELLKGSRADRETLSLLLIDIDHFKLVNDQFGHLAGDLVLRIFADAVGDELRKMDLFGRFGGEEFVVLLRGADLDDALQVAEKLRVRISRLAVPWQDVLIRLTVSIGVAAAQERATTLFDLIGRADRGLYSAKGSGRNRVVIAARS